MLQKKLCAAIAVVFCLCMAGFLFAEEKKPITNSIGMKFVYIPSGTFMMGSPENEPGRNNPNETQHKVTLTKGFYMQTTEITVGQWRQFVKESGYKTEAETENGSYIGKSWKKENDTNWKSPGFEQWDSSPVTCVSWNDTQAFIKWLNRKEVTDKYRLPTEAEWEYSARAGTTTPFALGKCLSTDQANYDGNQPLSGCPKGEYRRKTVSVGSFAPNAWGLYDMHGNALEWVQDIFSNGAIYTAEQTDPIYAGDGSCKYRVIRDGNYYSEASGCRSANRFAGLPGISHNGLGFRLVRSE